MTSRRVCDNILVKDGTAYRIDNGGSFRYRAQGALKGGDGSGYGTKVVELDTLRDAKVNPQTAAIFKGITDQEITRQVAEIESKRAELLAALPEELRTVVGQRIDEIS